jgi:hypothetical protein
MLTVLNYFAANIGLRLGGTLFQHYGLKATAIAIGIAGVWFLTDRRKPQTPAEASQAGSAPRPDDVMTRFRRAAAAWSGEHPDAAGAPVKTAVQTRQRADEVLL